ncbi:MAG TPA: hypothetical protein VMI06_13535, partial [Terriglobia bacterium]|nr:hypothetical protein [Terriglobia bacterium]
MPKPEKLALPMLLLAFLVCSPSWAAQNVPQAQPAQRTQTAPGGQVIQESSLAEPGASPGESPEFTHIVNQIVARENQLVQTLQRFTPRMEIYIQDMRPDPELGAVPVDDHYFLGRVQFRPNRTIMVRSLLPVPNFGSRFFNHVSGQITQFVSARYQPSDFYSSLVLDPTRFNRQYYNFKFVRREYLGNVRCLVFNVTPRVHVYRRLLLFHA